MEKYPWLDEDVVREHSRRMNNLYWIHFGDLSMSKFCKLTGSFVSNDFICEGCSFCGSTSKEDKEEVQNSSEA